MFSWSFHWPWKDDINFLEPIIKASDIKISKETESLFNIVLNRFIICLQLIDIICKKILHTNPSRR